MSKQPASDDFPSVAPKAATLSIQADNRPLSEHSSDGIDAMHKPANRCIQQFISGRARSRAKKCYACSMVVTPCYVRVFRFCPAFRTANDVTKILLFSDDFEMPARRPPDRICYADFRPKRPRTGPFMRIGNQLIQ